MRTAMMRTARMRTAMTTILRRLGTILALVGLLGLAAPAGAQDAPPTPPPGLPNEAQLLQELQKLQGRVSIPDPRAATLIQPQGRAWRDFHRDVLPWLVGGAILGMAALLAVFYAARGRIRIDAGPSGKTIRRFGDLDRFIHWMTALSFIVLALTGLNVSVGRIVLLPLLGPESFTYVSEIAKLVHNFVAFPFMLGLVMMFFAWQADNFFGLVDLKWIAKGGGLFRQGVHPPARRFNFGQKLIFWSVILGGIAISVSGIVMLFPFWFTDVTQVQLAVLVHAVASVVLIAITLAHIYIGSVGMEGAFAAMGDGRVDLNWAKEHHSLWVEEELARARARDRARAVAAE
jgi:formate dehydrogenase subunit gamma